MERAGTESDERSPHAGREEAAAEGRALPVPVSAATPLASFPEVPSRRLEGPLPTVQVAAVAAGGFVAGAAVAGLVRRRRQRPVARRRWGLPRRGREAARGKQSAKGGSGELLQVIASRSLLVDVHLLGVPGRNADA
jgi:hypothetical protein